MLARNLHYKHNLIRDVRFLYIHEGPEFGTLHKNSTKVDRDTRRSKDHSTMGAQESRAVELASSLGTAQCWPYELKTV